MVELVQGNRRALLADGLAEVHHLTPAFLGIWKCQMLLCPCLSSATSPRSALAGDWGRSTAQR